MTTNTLREAQQGAAMLTFRNDADLHAQFIAQAEAHYAADMLRAGTYGEGAGAAFKACSIGCYVHDLNLSDGNLHANLADHYALPEWLWRWRDTVFEGLPEAERAQFHVDLSRLIPLGVDLSPVPHWLAMDRIDRMLAVQRKALDMGHPQGVRDAIAGVVAMLESQRRLHEAQAGGASCDWSAASSAASSAEWSAEWSARSAESAAAWSASSAAWSARSAAAWSASSAAWSAASAARSAASAASAESAAYQAERDAMYAVLAELRHD